MENADQLLEMTKRLHRLTARMVQTATRPGRYSDGGDLYLAVSKSGAKRWTFLYNYRGKQREAGLGAVIAVSLAEAREKAAERRSLLARQTGVYPASRAHVRACRRSIDRIKATKLEVPDPCRAMGLIHWAILPPDPG